ncbi:DUF4783 domain-containing protein [uncultured Bacteroides sp.]|uniref:DUF4783 domain-containing protein n=1 Tax=uncultured Bacteroides sp. TaxID=162156 RepID=UPI002AAB5CB0|nr:DUF4783 domain-containing protein [uncultured Bacteroides sp.]
MGKKVVLYISSMLFCLSSLFAQDMPAGVTQAFKKGNAQELSKYFGDTVELIILNRSSNADKQAAEDILADFFANNKVHDFKINHQGKREESSFAIGTLSTVNGYFRVNCFFKRIENKYLIHQIRIDKTNE